MTDPRAEPTSLLAPLGERYDDLLARIEELVNIDSGSYSPEGVNRVADRCQDRFEAGGWEVERHRHRPDQEWTGAPLGDLVVGRRAGSRPVADGGRRLLLLAHMDTVFDDGTAAARPFRVRDGRAYGPGAGRWPPAGGACCCWPTWTRCSTRARPRPGRSGPATAGPTGRG